MDRPTAALANLSTFIMLDKAQDKYWTSLSVEDAEKILFYVRELEKR